MACHVVCSCTHYIINRHLVAIRSRDGLDQDRGTLSGSGGRPVPLCLTDSGLGGRHTGLPGAFLRAPVLRPSTPGSVTVTHVGAGFMLLFRGLWQLLQLWGGSFVFPPTLTSIQRVLISTSPQFSSSLFWKSSAQHIYLPWQAGTLWRH